MKTQSNTQKDYLQDDLMRGVRTKNVSEGKTPRAAWRTTQSILNDESLHYTDRKFLLGCVNGKLIGHADDRHTVTVANSRGHKGVSAIIPTLIKYKGSTIVIDPKGENAAITAEYRAKQLGQDV